MNEDRVIHRKRVCILATVPFVLKWFMTPQILNLRKKYDLTLISKGSSGEFSELLGKHVSFVPIKIERKISILDDLIALTRLWLFFRKEKFDIIHSIMPKAGFLSLLAGKLAQVPIRLHTFTGQVWATQKGLKRLLLMTCDRILASNATMTLADSPSQRLFLIKNNIVEEPRIRVLSEGSIAGVNLKRFNFDLNARQNFRLKNKVSENAVLFLYVGRLSTDKGVLDLSQAFSKAATQNTDIHLMIVGPDEGNIDTELASLSKRFPGRVHRVGFTDYPEKFMSAADVLCLPSHREGFGVVIIEAASVGIPSIASRIYGITDAVEDGVTGILHQPSSSSEIAEAMLLVASDKSLRLQMGAAARKRAADKFSEERIMKAFSEFYESMFLTIKHNSQ